MDWNEGNRAALSRFVELLTIESNRPRQSEVLPAALAFFQRALAAAESAAFTFFFGFGAGLTCPAIRFLTPARIAASPAALSFRFLAFGVSADASTIIVGTTSPRS